MGQGSHIRVPHSYVSLMELTKEVQLGSTRMLRVLELEEVGELLGHSPVTAFHLLLKGYAISLGFVISKTSH